MKESHPQLKIDWGTNIRADMHLTPEFFLTGLPSEVPPVVYFPPDARMNRDHWQTFPRVRMQAEAFYFDQKMIFDRSGKFVLEVYIIQSVPGGKDPLCWRGTLRVTVSPDRASRSVTIEAETFTGGNMGELDANITIKAGNVVLDGTDDREFNRTLDGYLNGKQRQKPEETPQISHLELEPVGAEDVRRCPYISFPCQPAACRALTLVHPNGVRTRIIADRAFRLGRNCQSSDGAVVNDVALSLLAPEGTDDATRQDLLYASGLFSRAHAMIALDEDGLWLHDTRGKGISQGLSLDGELIPKEKSRRLVPESQKTRLLAFAHLLELEMTLNWDDFSGKTPLPMPAVDVEAGILALYLRQFSLAPMDFQRSRRAGVSSVTLRHRAYHGALDSGCGAAEKVAYLCEKLRHSLSKEKDAVWIADWEKRFRQWLSRPRPNPRVDRENYLLLMTHATLGGSTTATLRFTGPGCHAWSNTLLRLWNFDRALYLEHLESDRPVTLFTAGQPDPLPLRPFRPTPITAGMTVRCGDAEFMFCEQ